ncbi:MAG: hypothetical protein WDN28_24805 [Chthoniobacter sp.]
MAALLGLLSSFVGMVETTKLSLHPPGDLLRADFYTIETVAQSKGMVALWPCCNDGGEAI